MAISAWVCAGTADEPAHRAGLAHAVEHMLFKGTARRDVGQVASEIEAAGGDINAWTSFDNIVVHARVPAAAVDLGLEVIADVLARPRFEPAEVELERQVILEELRHAADEPQRHLGRALFGEVFRRHPYRRPVLGNERSVARLDRDELVAFRRERFVAGDIVLAVAGGFDSGSIEAQVAAHLGALPPGRVNRRRAAEPPQLSVRERVVGAEVGEAHLVLAFPTPGSAHRDLLSLDLMSMALGQGESSRLHHRLERDSALASTSGAYVHGFLDAGLFVATATVPSSDAAEILACAEALAETTFSLACGELSDDELTKVARGIVADSVYGLETCDGAAAAVGSAWAHTGDPAFEESRARWAREAQPGDLGEVARAVLRPDRATFAAMLPRDARSSIAAGAFSRLIGRAASSLRAAPKVRQPRSKTAPTRSPAVAKTRARAPETMRYELENGARLIVRRDPSVPLVAAQATWSGGLRFESSKTAGIGALLANSITRGCGTRDGESVAAALDSAAMTMSGFSGRNSFGIRAEWLASDWSAGVDLLFDCMLAPSFDDAEIRRERGLLIDDAASRASSPAHVAHRLFVETLYQRHPYRLDPQGTVATLEQLGSTEVRDFYRAHYPASAVTLAIVGDVDPAAVHRAVRARLASAPAVLPDPVMVKRESFANRSDSARERFAFLDRSQAHLVVGFPGATIADEQRFALEALAAVLGGQGGRLFVSLRERRGIVYRVSAQSQEGVDPGMFAIVLACQPEHVATAIAEIKREIDALRAKPIGRGELARAVAFLIGAHDSTLERRSALAAALAFQEAHGAAWRDVFALPSTLRKLTPADLRAAALRYLDWDLAVTATVLPPMDTPEVRRRARGSRRRAPARRRPQLPARHRDKK